MSDELDTTIRIIELVTQTGIYAIRLSKDCSLKAFEKLQDIYHAGVLSKAGQMNYEKLIKHVGRDTVILDFHIEDSNELEQLKRGLTEYKVSFVQLPDMEVGDGRTQFMIDASDAAKVSGYLKANTNIKMNSISANEYTSMGKKEQWDEMNIKAQENLKKESKEIKKTFSTGKNQSMQNDFRSSKELKPVYEKEPAEKSTFVESQKEVMRKTSFKKSR